MNQLKPGLTLSGGRLVAATWLVSRIMCWSALCAGAAGCEVDRALPGVNQPILDLGPDLGPDLVMRDLAMPDLAVRRDFTVPNDLVLLPGYPAPHSPLPQVVHSGGPLLTAPELTAVTFGADPLRPQLESFVAKVGASSWWNAVASEYGIGSTSVRPPVNLQEVPPRDLDDSEIADWLAQKLDGTHPEFGTGNSNSLFMLFYPARTTITLDGGISCATFGAYHNSTTLPNGKDVAYAVMPRCRGTIDSVSYSASHEIIEAATDPLFFPNPAYKLADSRSQGWSRVSYGGEVGDMCQVDPQPSMRPFDLPFLVQRTWSNRAASMDHEPCVPANDSHFYFNSAPVLPMGNPILSLKVGTPVTIPLELFSTGPTEPWNLSAMVAANVDASLDFEFVPPTGVNGDKVMLKVTPTFAGVSSFHDGFLIMSELRGQVHVWPVAFRTR